MRFRLARQEDWGQISSISSRAGYDDYINQVGPAYLQVGRIYVAEEERIMGFVKVEDLPDGSTWASGMRVAPEFRRLGVASSLMEHAISSEAARSDEMRLIVEDSNTPSLNLVSKLGFRKVSGFEFHRGNPLLGETEDVEIERGSFLNIGWRFARAHHASFHPRALMSGGITVYRASETAYHVLRPTPRVEILPSEGYTAVEVGSGIEVAGSTDRSVFFLFSRKI
ncbi:hypothetical protein GCM10007108_02090 [Thermogymnomonas acidicola]|uniref:N-acetyltransferase domain-containing protein n=1 Tax=Thermogymnomonas acidicola TaxID=399579 RepID=A0AA37F8R1_9ARCH|nr:GNAT family N-acetyltransferase [Thermogymnomonas acidicola]GGM67642.1 hypothetical protein GCM10007108_02090 [Thermogymnomonas acidicola]